MACMRVRVGLDAVGVNELPIEGSVEADAKFKEGSLLAV